MPAPARLHRLRRHPPRVRRHPPRAGGRNRGLLLSVAQLQDLLGEWLVHCHHRLHEDLRHPTLPRKALTPHQMWAALIAVAGHLTLPLSGSDCLELLPVQAVSAGNRPASLL
ncbi:hypothetical protein ACPCSG_33265 [Streptomyces cellulosae]